MTDTRTLAERYVIGLLEPEEREKVMDRISAPRTEEDHVLAAEVRAVQDAWQAVDAGTEVMRMPDAAWARIEQEISAAPEPAPKAVPQAPLPPPRKAVRAQPAGQAMRRWRTAAAVAVAACLALGAVLLSGLLTPSPLVMAVLLDEDGNSVAVVEAFDNDSVRITPLVPVSAGGAEVLQVWTKPDPDGPPVSLGILEQAMRMRLSGPDLPLPAEDQLYEITIEPPGGSPTGLPTGPIVGKGLAQRAF